MCFSCCLLQHIFKYLTGPADLHLLTYVDIFGAVTLRSTDKPAHVTTLKFVYRAAFFHLTCLSLPAGLTLFPLIFFLINQKPELPFNMQRDLSPSLFVTVNCF